MLTSMEKLISNIFFLYFSLSNIRKPWLTRAELLLVMEVHYVCIHEYLNLGATHQSVKPRPVG